MPELRGVLQHPELHARYATDCQFPCRLSEPAMVTVSWRPSMMAASSATMAVSCRSAMMIASSATMAVRGACPGFEEGRC